MANITQKPLSENPLIDSLLWVGWKWADPVITYAFPTSLKNGGYTQAISDFQALDATDPYVLGTHAAFSQIRSFTNLRALEMQGGNSLANADIKVAMSSEMNVGRQANGAPPTPGYGDKAGQIFVAPPDGIDPSHTMMHEIGHTLGLKHPFDPMTTTLDASLDSWEYTVMAYSSANSDAPSTYMQLDIQALQYLYGANYDYNATDTTYRWDPESGEMLVNGIGQGVPVNGKIFMTVWDGGGVDTYDFSSYTTDVAINLTPGASSLASFAQLASYSGKIASGNVYNALLFEGDERALIENAIGGSRDDTLIGNDASNRLEGGAGEDTLHGAGGLDTLIGGADDDIYLLDDVARISAGGLLVGEGFDTVVEGADEGIDTVLVGHVAGSLLDHTHYTLPDNVENGIVISVLGFSIPANAFDPFDITGNELNNELTGNDAANTFIGLDGKDTLDGHGGLDTLIGGADNDTYILHDVSRTSGLFVGEVYDTVIEEADGGVDTVKVSYAEGGLFDHTHYALPDNVENGTVEGFGVFDITGNDLNNELRGNSAANVLVGAGGNDVLYGSEGLDELVGGAGDDTYYLTDVSRLDGLFVGEVYDAVVEAAGEGNDWIEIGPVEGALFNHTSYTLPENVENARVHDGTPFDVIGNELDNTLIGSEGVNTLNGLDGRDTLEGGAGLDTLVGGSDDDTYVLKDVSKIGGLLVGEVYDTVIEDTDGGTDLVQVGHVVGSLLDVTHYVLPDNVENGTITGVDAFDIIGNKLSNRISGNVGANALDGAGGRDYLFGKAGDDILHGGSGSDFLAGGFNSRIEATGFDGDDVIYGDAGDDLITVLWGNDVVHGGDDNDTLSFAEVKDNLTLDLSAGAVTYQEGGTTFDEHGNPIDSFSGQYTVTWDGIENLVAGKGTDVITGDANDNKLDGGLGADTVVLRGSRSEYTVTVLANGDIQIADRIAGRDGTDVLANVETLRFSDGDVTVSTLQSIVGTPGEDRLVGDAADNHLLGLAGDDVLIGNAGADILDGGGDVDTADYSRSVAGVSVDLASGAGHGGDAEGDTFIGIEHAIGSAFDDIFRGGSDRGQFLAGDGDDMMIGGSWFDWFEGGNGNDTFIGTGGQMAMFGGDGDDRMIGSQESTNYFDGGLGDDIMIGGNSVDYIADMTGGSEIMHGGAGNDMLDDFYGHSQLFGEDGDDFVAAAGGFGLLDGGAGDDYVTVANGDYVLVGGAGADKLEFAGTGSAEFSGGAGADTFTYRVGAGPITVSDFEDGVDHIFLWDHHYNGNVPLESLTIADGAEGAVVSWYGHSQMVLTGIQASQLDSSDFTL